MPVHRPKRGTRLCRATHGVAPTFVSSCSEYRTVRLEQGWDVPNDLSSFRTWSLGEKALSMGTSRDHRRFLQYFFKISLDKLLIH